MKLENCVLNVDLTTIAPLTRNEPEEAWSRAHKSGAIPEALFQLYCKADFLSFGAGPSFLRDGANILFSYFTMILRSLLEALVEADEQIPLFVETQGLTYDLGKKARRERWDPEADSRARRHFRDFLIALQVSLDSLADWPDSRFELGACSVYAD
jgi:hypothetical protein